MLQEHYDETIQIPLQVSTRTLYSSSSQSSINSNTEIDQDRVPCDLCLKTFKKKGLTKHRNSCLKNNNFLSNNPDRVWVKRMIP